MSDAITENQDPAEPKWKPLSRIQRRIVGVLIEKAKTTPDAYPLSLNALTTGCNQKSNRFPQMDADPEQVEEALDQLRAMGAVGEVQSGGRVPKYRHYMKEWLGVDGTELAVMAELMLRGAQTVGELRGRAARMATNQLGDVAALRPVLKSLIDRGLVVELSPEGRGQMVSHTLYLDQEMDKVRRETAASGSAETATGVDVEPPVPGSLAESTRSNPAGAAPSAPPASRSDILEIRQEMAQLREDVSRLRKDLDDIWASLK